MIFRYGVRGMGFRCNRFPCFRGQEDRGRKSAAELQKLRGAEDPLERQKLLSGRCATCKHFALCGGGFRTRAAFANGHWFGSDPGCYLSDDEIHTEIQL